MTHRLDTALLDGGVQRLRWSDTSGQLDNLGVLIALERDPSAADALNAAIAGAPSAALYWEMPPLLPATLARPWECVLVPAQALEALPCDRRTFAAHFAQADGRVAVFPNLGGDAMLVAPVPGEDGQPWTHLALFCRTAPRVTQRAFWRALARTTHTALGSAPVWVSTSGLGVGWLHARVEHRPKYYTYGPYRRPPGS